jgi:large subunit ribosomal protein L25
MTGKKVSRKLWKEGKIPAVYYHKGEDNLNLELELREVQRLIASEHSIVELVIDGGKKKKQCIVKKVQFDPVKGFPIHVDFQGVKAGEKIRTEVHVKLVGEPIGKKHGGYLEHLIRELEVECLPKDLPDHIEIDISGLDVGHTIHVKDIEVDKVKILDDPEEVICMIEAPKVGAVEEAEEAVEEEEQQPEVIKQKNVEEE